MKLGAALTFLGSGASITALTTYLEITPTIELQILLFLNICVLLAVLLRKHLQLPIDFPSEQDEPGTLRKRLSNTSWFVKSRLGLKRRPPESTAESEDKPEGGGSGIGSVVPVVETIDPAFGCGKVRYKGINWPAKAAEVITSGENVKIIGRDILTLIVEKIGKQTAAEEEIG
jgi:membrane protein implicated in regulation of membrane protease activity